VTTLLRLIGRRLVAFPIMVLGVTFLVFFVMSFSPADPARLALGESASQEALDQYRADNGLDQPLLIRYGLFLAGLVRGDLGISAGNVPVTEFVAKAFPITLQLTFVGLIIAVVLALVLGVIAALFRDRWPDQVIRVLSIAALATPSFWLAILLIQWLSTVPGGQGLYPALRRPVGEDDGLTHATDAAEHWAAVARSDDGGDTWRLGEWIGPDCDESKVVEAASGVLLHARARPRRRWAMSDDGGVTFTAPVPHPALVDPACNGGLCRWGDVLVCSLLDDEKERRRLVLRTSADEGRTWSPGVVADAGGAAYSALAPLADGTLGLLYEAGDYDALIFRRVTRADLGLDGGGPALVPRAGAGAARPPEVAP